MLRRLLTLRFGELPEVVSDRLAAAGEAEIEEWLGRVLGARTLDEVLSGGSG
jgi:hypothetical protein